MSGFLALLDDVAAIAKLAASQVDDVAAHAVKAGGKSAGIVIDDAAVTPKYVTGLPAAREIRGCGLDQPRQVVTVPIRHGAALSRSLEDRSRLLSPQGFSARGYALRRARGGITVSSFPASQPGHPRSSDCLRSCRMERLLDVDGFQTAHSIRGRMQ